MSLKHLPLLVVSFAAFATTAGAQFTAAVAPPRAKVKVDSAVKQDSVRRATVALAARVTDMRKWVDSAAGVTLPAADSATSNSHTAVASAPATQAPQEPRAKRDSATINRNSRVRTDSAASIATVEVHDSTGLKNSDTASTASAATPDTSRRVAGDTRRFSNGAPAPATASALPFIAIIGATTLLVGATLRRP